MRLAATTLLLLLAAAGAATAKTPLPGFRSPSGNIRCFVVPGRPPVLRCQISRSVYAKRLTAHCSSPAIGVDWAGFELTPGRKGAVTCSGGVLYEPDRQVPVFVKQPYGTTWRHGAFACDSEAAGVTCRNRTGHGLFLSRGSWRAW